MNILFLCTHNRCRSILAEAICNAIAHPQIRSFSAGSDPSLEVHPATLKYLNKEGINIEGLASESWDAYKESEIDVVVTVCDRPEMKSPAWLRDLETVHWGLPDPSQITRSDQDMSAAFKGVIRTLERRANALSKLNVAMMETHDFADYLRKLEHF